MDEKTKKPRRTRVDSISSVSAAIVAGGKAINLPHGVTLSPKQRIIFTELCNEFSKTELTAHKIRLIAGLAYQMQIIEEQLDLLNTEGSVFINSHGNATANPRAKLLQQYVGSMLALRRSLGIHARELAGGDNRATGIRRGHNKANEALYDDLDGDLLARPNVVPITGRESDDDE